MNEPVGASVTHGSITTGRRTVTTFLGDPSTPNRFLKAWIKALPYASWSKSVVLTIKKLSQPPIRRARRRIHSRAQASWRKPKTLMAFVSYRTRRPQ